jgi:hypothetical protein
VFNNLGLVGMLRQEYDAAQEFLTDSMLLSQKLGDKSSTASAMNNLGGIAQKRKDYKAADASFKQSLTIRAELGDQYGISLSLLCLGESALYQQNDDRAIILLAASAALRGSIAAPLSEEVRTEFSSHVETLKSRRGENGFEEMWRYGSSLDLQQVLIFAHDDSKTSHTS